MNTFFNSDALAANKFLHLLSFFFFSFSMCGSFCVCVPQASDTYYSNGDRITTPFAESTDSTPKSTSASNNILPSISTEYSLETSSSYTQETLDTRSGTTSAPTPAPTATQTPAPTATQTPAPTATQTPAPTATQTPAPTTASPTNTDIGTGGNYSDGAPIAPDATNRGAFYPLTSFKQLTINLNCDNVVSANPDIHYCPGAGFVRTFYCRWEWVVNVCLFVDGSHT